MREESGKTETFLSFWGKRDIMQKQNSLKEMDFYENQ